MCTAFCDGIRHIVDNLREYQTTFMVCVPALYENIYDEKLHNKKIEELKKEVDKISRPSYRTKEAYFYNREMFSTYLYS